jgi:hypothetical protein
MNAAVSVGTTLFPTLVSHIQQRKAEGRDPFVLLLGKDCARAVSRQMESMLQSFIESARQSFLKWFPSDLAQGLVGRVVDGVTLPDEDVIDSIYRLTESLGFQQQNLILRNLYAQIPVPLFYQDLARLIKLGYFTQIVTTNIDDLLEQALTGSFGMLQGKDFDVMTLKESDTPTGPPAPISILKLHGDLKRSNAVLSEEDIERLLTQRRHFAKRELAGDVIVFGYDGESEPTEELLVKTVSSELWWINEDKPSTPLIEKAGVNRSFFSITGSQAAPAEFFGILYDSLRRAPIREKYRSFLAQSRSMNIKLPSDILESTGTTAEPQDASGDDTGSTEADLLQGQLRSAQRQLFELRRSVVPDREDTALENQILYQEQEIARLEDQLRALGPNRRRVLNLIDSMWKSVDGNQAIDGDTQRFIQTHRDLVANEFEKTAPNHALIGAALSALASVGARLDASVVDRSTIRRLSEFAPSLKWS